MAEGGYRMVPPPGTDPASCEPLLFYPKTKPAAKKNVAFFKESSKE